MKLSSWVKREGGRERVAKLLGVTPVAVHHWLSGRATPKWSTAYKIMELSKGKVTAREIAEETFASERAQAMRKGAR